MCTAHPTKVSTPLRYSVALAAATAVCSMVETNLPSAAIAPNLILVLAALTLLLGSFHVNKTEILSDDALAL